MLYATQQPRERLQRLTLPILVAVPLYLAVAITVWMGDTGREGDADTVAAPQAEPVVVDENLAATEEPGR